MKFIRFSTCLVVCCAVTTGMSFTTKANAVSFSSKAIVEPTNNNEKQPIKFKSPNKIKIIPNKLYLKENVSYNDIWLKHYKLAKTKTEEQNYADAITEYQQSLDVLEKHYADSKYTLIVLEKLSWLSNNLNDTNSTICYLGKLFSLQEKYGTNYDLFSAYNLLADTYSNDNKLYAYEDTLKQALTYSDSKFGTNSLQSAKVLSKLGKLKFQAGEYLDAEYYLSESIEIKNKYKKNDKSLIEDYDYAALANNRLKDFSKAENYYSLSYKLKEKHKYDKKDLMVAAENLIISSVHTKNIKSVEKLINKTINYRLNTNTDKNVETARLYLIKAGVIAQSEESYKTEDFLDYSLKRYRDYINSFNLKYEDNYNNLTLDDLKNILIAYDDMINICQILELKREEAIYSRKFIELIKRLPKDEDITFYSVLS